MSRRQRQDARRQHGQVARGVTLGQARAIANAKRQATLITRVHAWLEQRQIAASERKEAAAEAREQARASRKMRDARAGRQEQPTKPDAVVLVDSQVLMGTTQTLAGEVTGPRSWRRAIGSRKAAVHPALAGGPWPARHKTTEHWVRRERRARQELERIQAGRALAKAER